MPKFYFREIRYSHPVYEVKAPNLEEARKLYEKLDNKGLRKCKLVSNETSDEFLYEIFDERQKLLWCDDTEREIPNDTANTAPAVQPPDPGGQGPTDSSV